MREPKPKRQPGAPPRHPPAVPPLPATSPPPASPPAAEEPPRGPQDTDKNWPPPPSLPQAVPRSGPLLLARAILAQALPLLVLLVANTLQACAPPPALVAQREALEFSRQARAAAGRPGASTCLASAQQVDRLLFISYPDVSPAAAAALLEMRRACEAVGDAPSAPPHGGGADGPQ